MFDVANSVYRDECGGCHVPYPPQLLPKASWQAIVAGLDKHFDSDASLDDKTSKPCVMVPAAAPCACASRASLRGQC